MGNDLYHNKWHAFNHYTVPLEGFPDSATDPIASKDTPFLGVFYNSLSSSLSGNPRSIGSSNSVGWWHYSSTTYAHSGWWELYPTVLNTTVTLSSNWNSGYSGFTTLCASSARFDSYFNTSLNLSGAGMYEVVGGVNGPGGVGWHIALSATTHRLNEAQANVNQKVARPVKLLETNKNIVWNLSAQTVYVQITGNYALSASEVKNLKKGGRYTMWVYIDRCPEDDMDMIFDQRYYNIAVKVLSGKDYFRSLTNVIRLSSSSITRIDFTCDGKKMLGKATQYSIWVPTEKDLYFKGLGIKMTDIKTGRNKSPVYVNTSNSGSLAEIGTPAEIGIVPGEWLIGSGGINIIERYFSNFTATSSLYVDGPPLSGIRMRFLNGNTQYMNFIVYNANWATSKQLSFNRSLTGSFDRIVGTLSAKGDFKNRIYANNLICSPGLETISDPLQELALPTPPYELVQSNIRDVTVCTSAYEVEIYSGKDRDIDAVFVNSNQIDITPVQLNGIDQPYNFLNERTCTVKFIRVQDDYTIEAYFKPQLPSLLPNNVLWFNALDNSLLNNEAGPIIDFYISWNLGTTTVTAYNPGEPVIQNEFDRPRINTFRSDSSFIKYMSAGFEVLCGSNKFYPWDNRLSGYEVVSIPVPGSFTAGVDFFTANYLPPTNITPSLGNWTQTPSQPGETKYSFVKNSSDYKTPITLISIGMGANALPWPNGSYPTVKTWETFASPTSQNPLSAFYSNTQDNKKLLQYNLSNAPNILTTGSLRSIQFNNGKFMTLNAQLTTLSGINYFKPFTTFTILSTTNNITNNSSVSSVIWWVGDFYSTVGAKGYGLLLKGNKLFNTISQTRPVATLSANELYIISTVYGANGNSNRVLLNNASTFNANLTQVQRVSSFNFIMGKNPDANNMYCDGLKIFDFYLFDRAFNRGELLEINDYLKDKFDSFK